jgi:putative transposase
MPGILIDISMIRLDQSCVKRNEMDRESAVSEREPLVGIDAKTSWYPAGGAAWRRRRRILGLKALAANYYHVMSRTCGAAVFFDAVEKEALKRVIWRVASFCGVEVVTYCVMGNHFHVLVSVPHRETWLRRFEGPEGERRLLGHLRTLYSRGYIEQLEAEIREWRRLGMESRVQEKLESFKRRMADLSRYVKEVKERFSRWYNQRHERRGTLWMDRFKSVLIEGPVGGRGEREEDRVDVVKAMAAYIDLNPVRAGLVADSREYPWCGYGEACAGEARAKRGLSRVLGRAAEAWEEQGAGAVYAKLLCGVDSKAGTRRQEKKRDDIPGPLPEEKGLDLPALVRRRVRVFSEGLVMGSKAFVNEVFAVHRDSLGAQRKEAGRKMWQSKAELYVLRRVRQSFE